MEVKQDEEKITRNDCRCADWDNVNGWNGVRKTNQRNRRVVLHNTKGVNNITFELSYIDGEYHPGIHIALTDLALYK